MLKVHHLENSRSQRVLWLLEELGVDYEIVRYERDKKTNLAPPALKKVHPLGKSPVIEDRGQVIAETGAIIEYILDHYGEGRLRPAPDAANFERYRYWSYAAEGSYMTPLLLLLILSRMETGAPFFIRPIAKKMVEAVRDGYLDGTLKALFGYLNDELGRAQWLAGDQFSAADIIMSFPMEGFATRADAGRYPRIKSFLETIHARPAYQRAIERGGPYALMS